MDDTFQILNASSVYSQSKAKELQNLQKENTALKKQFLNLNNKCSLLMAQINECRKVKTATDDILNSLKIKSLNMAQQLLLSNEKYQEMQITLFKTCQRLKKNLEEKNELQKNNSCSLENYSKQIEKAQGILKEQLSVLNQENCRLKKQLMSKIQENTTLQKNNKKFEERSTKQLKKFSLQLQVSKKKSAQCQQLPDKQRNELCERQRVIMLSKIDISQKENEFEQKCKELKQKQIELEKYKNQIANQNNTMIEIKNENAKIENQMKKLKQKLKIQSTLHQKAIKDNTTEKKALQQELEALRLADKNKKNLIQQLSKQLEAMKDRSIKGIDSNSSLKTEDTSLKETKNSLSNQDKKSSVQNNKIKKTQKEIIQQQNERGLKTMSKTIQSHQKKLNELKEKKQKNVKDKKKKDNDKLFIIQKINSLVDQYMFIIINYINIDATLERQQAINVLKAQKELLKEILFSSMEQQKIREYCNLFSNKILDPSNKL